MIPNPYPRRLWTLREAAAFIGVSPNTLARLSAAGKIPVYRINERGDRRYDPGDLDRYLLRRLEA